MSRDMFQDRRCGRSSAGTDAVLLHQTIERVSRDAELASCAPDDAVVPRERLFDFSLGEFPAWSRCALGWVRAGRRRCRWCTRAPSRDLRRQQVHGEPVVRRPRDHAPDDELELTDVAGPLIAMK